MSKDRLNSLLGPNQISELGVNDFWALFVRVDIYTWYEWKGESNNLCETKNFKIGVFEAKHEESMLTSIIFLVRSG